MVANGVGATWGVRRGRVHRRHILLHRRQLIAGLEKDRWASLVEGSSCTASGPARHLLRFGMIGGWCALSLLVTPPSSLGLELKEWFPFAAKRRIRAALIACNKQRICLVEVTKEWGLAHTGENYGTGVNRFESDVEWGIVTSGLELIITTTSYRTCYYQAWSRSRRKWGRRPQWSPPPVRTTGMSILQWKEIDFLCSKN